MDSDRAARSVLRDPSTKTVSGGGRHARSPVGVDLEVGTVRGRVGDSTPVESELHATSGARRAELDDG
jgi:hypothetical protein